MLEVVLDRGDEGRDTHEGATTDAVAGDFAEPAFDQIEPGAAGGNEVKVHARMTAKPALNRRTFVRAHIVEHDMNRHPVRLQPMLRPDAPQEPSWAHSL